MKTQTKSNKAAQSSTNRVDENKFAKVLALVEAGNCEDALKVLGSTPGDVYQQNARGVCLMRTGRADTAVHLFRHLVMEPGGTHNRTDVLPEIARNFATALLMVGLPGGVGEILDELPESNHPAAVRIKTALNDWTKSLSFFRRLDWKISRIAPAVCNIPLNFEPGEFVFQTQPQQIGNEHNGAETIRPTHLAA